MRTKKVIETSSNTLSTLSKECQSLYLSLIIKSDDAGIIPLDGNYNPKTLDQMIQKGSIIVTSSDIILRGFISSNYGNVLKPDYNPHKPILSQIENSGYNYNSETNEIDVPLNDQISDLPSLFKLCNGNNDTIAHQRKETTPQGLILNESKIINYLGSLNFALYLSIGLMTAQSIHSSFTLYNISHIPNPYNLVFAVFTAFILDFLVIFFTIRGKVVQTMVFFIFCSLMSLYSYHLNTAYFTYQSFFAIIVSIAVPYSVYSVSGMVNNAKV